MNHDTPTHHTQASCDALIANGPGSESEREPMENEDLLGDNASSALPELEPGLESETEAGAGISQPSRHPAGPRLSAKALKRRAQITRYIALFCACCLSVGSH